MQTDILMDIMHIPIHLFNKVLKESCVNFFFVRNSKIIKKIAIWILVCRELSDDFSVFSGGFSSNLYPNIFSLSFLTLKLSEFFSLFYFLFFPLLLCVQCLCRIETFQFVLYKLSCMIVSALYDALFSFHQKFKALESNQNVQQWRNTTRYFLNNWWMVGCFPTLAVICQETAEILTRYRHTKITKDDGNTRS